MNLPLLKQTFRSNLANWGLTTLIMNLLLGQMITMEATRTLLGPMFYGMLVPALISIFIITVGNKLLAGQVDRGSMAYILTAPIKRITVTMTQMIYMIGSLAVTFGLMTATAIATNGLVDAGINNHVLVYLNLGAFALSFAFAGIMFAASGICNLSKRALGTGGMLILAFLLLAIIGSFANYGVSGLETVQHLTIVSLFDYKNILIQGDKWLPELGILAAIRVAAFAAGSTVFTKKDLPL